MAVKKEKLKLYRLVTRSSYSTPAPSANNPVKGYINYYVEFKRWDVENSQEFSTMEYSEDFLNTVSPFKFFSDTDKFGEYSKISFVIDGVHEPYDRNKHDLDALSPKIFTLAASTEEIIAKPVNTSEDSGERALEKKPSPPTTLTFYINPTGIQVQKKKLFSQIRTKGGWAFQHWGPHIGEINLEGTTGNISAAPKIRMGTVAGIPIIPQVVDEIPSTSNSMALKAFRELERWYDEDQNEHSQNKGYLTAIEYRQRIYIGHIADFAYNEKGDKPFQLYYKLKFLVHYDAGNLAAATSRARNQIVRNEETLEYIRGLKTQPVEFDDEDEDNISL
ncbi:MAG: hypothetical protein U9R15_18085 [Chloroflexota bacterium]|nr:hypothetical protein [Chloroflexota bacterium]